MPPSGRTAASLKTLLGSSLESSCWVSPLCMRQWKLLSEPLPFPWQWRSRKEKKNNNKGSILSSWLQRATAAQSRLLHGTPLLVPLDKTQLSPAFYPPAFPPTLLSISLSPPLIFNLIFPPFFFSSVHTSKMRLLSSDKHVGTTDWAHSVRALTFYLIESFSLTDQLKVVFFWHASCNFSKHSAVYLSGNERQVQRDCESEWKNVDWCCRVQEAREVTRWSLLCSGVIRQAKTSAWHPRVTAKQMRITQDSTTPLVHGHTLKHSGFYAHLQYKHVIIPTNIKLDFVRTRVTGSVYLYLNKIWHTQKSEAELNTIMLEVKRVLPLWNRTREKPIKATTNEHTNTYWCIFGSFEKSRFLAFSSDSKMVMYTSFPRQNQLTGSCRTQVVSSEPQQLCTGTLLLECVWPKPTIKERYSEDLAKLDRVGLNSLRAVWGTPFVCQNKTRHLQVLVMEHAQKYIFIMKLLN